jgi:hypothetical protein
MTDNQRDPAYRPTPRWKLSRRANTIFWLDRYRVTASLYCLKGADTVTLRIFRDMARVAPRDAVLCGRKDCGH